MFEDEEGKINLRDFVRESMEDSTRFSSSIFGSVEMFSSDVFIR